MIAGSSADAWRRELSVLHQCMTNDGAAKLVVDRIRSLFEVIQKSIDVIWGRARGELGTGP